MTEVERPVSRPLSEISENEDRRRVSARASSYSSSLNLKGGGDRLSVSVSRPTSEVLEESKRVSLPVHTITLNLADYTGAPSLPAPKASPAPAVTVTTTAPAVSSPPTSTPAMSPSSVAPASSTKRKSVPPPKPEKPAELSSPPIDHKEELIVDLTEDLSETQDGVSPLFMATRAALRPAPMGSATSHEANPIPSPSSASSFDSPRSSIDFGKAPPRIKQSWYKRASMAPVLRTSRSPATTSIDLPSEPLSPHFATSHPPALPPRKFPAGPLDTTSPHAGPSRAAPPRHPAASHHSQSHSGARTRWGWTPTTTGVTRSASSNSIATNSSHQRMPSSAQRVLGSAGNAVSKTWMRARGVGTSMSVTGLQAFSPTRDEPVSPGLLVRQLSREFESTPEVPTWEEGVVKRQALPGRTGLVIGHDLDTVGRTWGVFDAAEDRPGETEYEQRRRRCLPAVAIRAYEYLTLWGPKEEGIFRISGRSSHIARLRKEFDAGADLDLSLCDPGDLDPHAVSGIFKLFLRELPSPLLPEFVEEQLDEFIVSGSDNIRELVAVIALLPNSSWFLLADMINLIELIPQHADVNRMSHNALMLSLGPTLRLSGDHVKLLLRYRQELFADPPLVDASDLIDFGDDAILSLTPTYEEMPVRDHSRSKRLGKKPSLSSLLGGSRPSTSVRRSQSDMVLSVSASPPRIGTLTGITDADEGEDVSEAAKAAQVQDAHYASGTVAARARLYSTPLAVPVPVVDSTTTPIADRFRRPSVASTIESALRGGSESIRSSHSSASASHGHSDSERSISRVRRSNSSFFHSATVLLHSNGSSPPRPRAKTGIKRKDDAASSGDGGSAKRLSSGPGVLDEMMDADIDFKL